VQPLISHSAESVVLLTTTLAGFDIAELWLILRNFFAGGPTPLSAASSCLATPADRAQSRHRSTVLGAAAGKTVGIFCGHLRLARGAGGWIFAFGEDPPRPAHALATPHTP